MSNKRSNYPNETPLDDYERELKEFLDKGEYVSSKNLAETKKMFTEAAKRHLELQKTKRITLRVKQEDLLKVKARAERSGVPYQRLVKALIHQYAEGETKIAI